MQITDLGKKKYSETKRQIRNAMLEHQLAIFVGAGASAGAGIPLWNKAVSKIAEKLSIENDKSRFDNLIIPQYYYNARGRKEYTQLMREIFRFYDKLSPSDIHDAIMRFGVETIITTNYDHLIEMAAENNGEFLYVVSQDSDLPYRKAGKELIKMHGDFEHDNFVLKEDDYLHYHKNFKLIENYIKSLIGTKTVLFVGYSLGDPDVKHIFSWVKEILDEHFQRAYLVVTGRIGNQNELEYFRHLGVNIIYATELFDEKDISLENHSEQLLQTLLYLLDKEEKQKSISEFIFDNLKPFVSLKYTYRKYIERVFQQLKSKVNEGITLRVDNDDYLVYSDTHALKEEIDFLKELNLANEKKSDDQKILGIIEALRSSAVKGTRRKKNDPTRMYYEQKEFSNNDTIPDWIKAISDFDYKKLNQIKDYNSKILSERKPELYLQQAYICSFLGDYLSAFHCLDNASILFYKKREYAWYFISVWNKKNIARIIISDFIYNWSMSREVKESIKDDYNNIDLDKTLQTIPDLGNENNRFLSDLKDFRFASDLFYDVVSTSVKASIQAKETYFLFAGMPAYEEMRRQVYDYYRYGIYNCLLVDRYRENNEIFNLFVRSIFASVAMPDKQMTNDSVFGDIGNVHADFLKSMDIHLILRYIESSKLRKLFNEFNIRIIEVDDGGKAYLESICDNIFTIFDLKVFANSDVFWRLICFISHTKMDENIGCSILHKLTELPHEEYSRSKRELLIELLNSLYMQKLFNNRKTCDMAKELIASFINIISNSKDCFLNYKTVIIALISFCKEGDVLFDDEEAIRRILTEDYYMLLADIYGGCADNVKIVIKNQFKKWTCPNSENGYKIYAKTVLAGVLKPDKAIEDRALEFLVEQNENKKKELEQGIETFSGDELDDYLVNLYLVDSIIDGNRLKEIVLNGDNRLAKWLVNVEEYDYNEFDLFWLKHCSIELLNNLANNKVVRQAILTVYKNRYKNEYIDNKTNEIVVEYFI